MTDLLADLDRLASEGRNPRTMAIDTGSAAEIVRTINAEDAGVAAAVAAALPQIARAVEAIVTAIEAGGRLIYQGAGTSGRLGVLDASECPPTFGVPEGLVVGIIAGGDRALRQAVEGVEDDPNAGQADLIATEVNARDVVVGIAASGRTPYVLGGLAHARNIGAVTGAITCNPDTPLTAAVDIAMMAAVGPEVIAGSTRLKAGTAQKLILNTLTTASMIQLGKTYGNLMVDVVPANAKLRARAVRIVMQATAADRTAAEAALVAAGDDVKRAILVHQCGCRPDEAEAALGQVGGRLRAAVSVLSGDAETSSVMAVISPAPDVR